MIVISDHNDEIAILVGRAGHRAEFDELENQIFEMEERKEELESILSGGESNHEKLGEYGKEYVNLQENLEKMYSRWEELGVLRPY